MRAFTWSVVAAAAAAGSAYAQPPSEPGTVGPNVAVNGGFEEVGPEGVPTGWDSIEPPTGLADEAHSGLRALRMVADTDKSVIVNAFQTGAPAFGLIRFWYKLISSASDGANIRLYAIPWKEGEAEPRAVWVAPREQVGDGQWHQGFLRYGFKTNPPAVIIAPRINEGGAAGKGEVLFDDIELYRLAPALEVTDIQASRPAALAGESVTLTCAVRNVGGEELRGVRIAHRAEGRARVSMTDREQTVDLAPGQGASVSFDLVSDEPGIVPIIVAATAGPVTAARRTSVLVSGPLPPAPRGEPLADAGVGDLTAWIGDSTVRLDVVRNTYGFGPGALYGRASGQWRLAGLVAPLIAVVVKDGDGVEEPPLLLTRARAHHGTTPRLALSGEARTRDGAVLDFDVTYRLRPRLGGVAVECRLRADRDLRVLAFRGPWLCAGERSFGADKHSALFGGLEYLNATEPSSNWLYSAPPLDDRRVPNPYKVTIPLMAVEQRGLVVGLFWDPLQEWAHGQRYPSAYFAAPNRFAHQQNHAMGLFAPAVPDWVAENELTAATPFDLKAGEPLTLSAILFAGEGESALAGMDRYFAAHPVPPPPEMPRTLDEQLQVMGMPPPQPALEQQLDDSARGIAARLALQRPDGSWGYEEPDKARELFKDFGPVLAGKEKTLGVPNAFSPDAYGKPGDSASGLQGWNLTAMLPYAMITGNEAVLDASLKGLEFLDRCDRPEGAQTWEVPLHAPDILASAQAVEAFLAAYRITGDKRYLDSARHWAQTGLPSTYLWNANDRPVMRYGTIPIYGTSIFVVSWYGTLVQWCGMWYSRALIHLSRYDDSFPWRKVGEGITACCVQQYQPDGTYKNAYPDGWSIVSNTYGGAPIHPGDIHRNIHLLKGTFCEPDFRALSAGDVRVCINAESPIADASIVGDELTVKLKPGPKKLARVSISSVADFAAVTVSGKALRDQAGDAPGWRRMPMYDNVLMLTVPGDRAAEIEVRGARFASVTRTPQASPPEWAFDRPGVAESWVAAHDLAPLTTSDGSLVCRATGPDPFMVGPPINVDAAALHVLHVRVRANRDAAIQVYWIRLLDSQLSAFGQDAVMEFPVQGDGQFHDYSVDLAGSDAWRGHIVALRLDPGVAGCEMEFASVALRGE